MNGLRVQRRVPGSYMCLRFLDGFGVPRLLRVTIYGFGLLARV